MQEDSDGDGWMLPGDDTVQDVEDMDAHVQALTLEEEKKNAKRRLDSELWLCVFICTLVHIIIHIYHAAAPVLIENFIDKQPQVSPLKRSQLID
jgi:hypothetical protein